MIRTPFTQDPFAHIWTPRCITDPVRYPCALEISRRSLWDRLLRMMGVRV